ERCIGGEIFFAPRHTAGLGIRSMRRRRLFGRRVIRKAAVPGSEPVHFSAMRTEDCHRKLLYPGKRHPVGVDAADDILAGSRAGENECGHDTPSPRMLHALARASLRGRHTYNK